MLIVGTRAHLEDLERSYTYAEDVSVTAVAVGTFFGGVGSLLPGGSRPVWALLDKERTVAVGEFDVTPLTPPTSGECPGHGGRDRWPLACRPRRSPPLHGVI